MGSTAYLLVFVDKYIAEVGAGRHLERKMAPVALPNPRLAVHWVQLHADEEAGVEELREAKQTD